MRIGVHTAQLGRLADPAAVRCAAQSAEEMGYSSLWVLDRLPAAIQPRTGYLGVEGAELPAEERRALDPFAVLAVSAAVTSRIRIGTSVLVTPWYSPAVMARMLTSLDVLSDGRLSVGLGLGWSVDEYEATATIRHQLGRRLDEALDVLDAHWTDGPIGYAVEAGTMVAAYNDLRPVQLPRPTVLLAGSTEAGLDRIARRADGWNPMGLPVASIGPMWNHVRDLAAGYGRDADLLQLVVRATIRLTDQPIEGDRPTYNGSLDQVADDLDATRRAGAHEVILRVDGDPTLDEALDAYARVAEAVDVRETVTSR